jgi:hypothetical protein
MVASVEIKSLVGIIAYSFPEYKTFGKSRKKAFGDKVTENPREIRYNTDTKKKTPPQNKISRILNIRKEQYNVCNPCK